MSRRMMPTLGSSQQHQTSPSGRRMVVLVLMVLSAGFGYWIRGRQMANSGNAPMVTLPMLPSRPSSPLKVAEAPSPSPNPVGNVASSAPAPALGTATAAAASETDPLHKQNHIKVASIRINGPLETSLMDAAGAKDAPALAQVVTRALVWWVQVPGDFRKGDKLDVLFEERSGQEPIVHAVRLESAKLGKVFRAYRYQAPGDNFARFYQPTGEELELRLKASPLDNYEQITSLIKDGRRHKGVDFKTPVGSPVKATFAGVITRKNWHFRANGNCLEVTDSGSRRKALFLHLSEIPKTEKVGDHVTVGQVIAHSGNTGHSFAPHLHYQLMAGDEKVLDPFEVNPSFRRTISPEHKAALTAEVQKLDGTLGSAVATK